MADDPSDEKSLDWAGIMLPSVGAAAGSATGPLGSAGGAAIGRLTAGLIGRGAASAARRRMEQANLEFASARCFVSWLSAPNTSFKC